MRKITFMTSMLVLLLVFSFVAAGCGGGGEEGVEESYVLKIGYLREVEGLNPHQLNTLASWEAAYISYNFLITYDQDLNYEPSLARDWEVDESGTVWTYHLQEGVTWHDGELFTAEDVKYTFDFLLENTDSYLSGYVANMVEITFVDEYTLTIKTAAPDATMPYVPVPILPEHIWGEMDAPEALTGFDNSNPVGTGPFHVIEFRRGEFVQFGVNENYFKGKPGLDEVIIIYYSNADTMIEALKQGELDAVADIPGAQFKALADANLPDIVTLAADGAYFVELAFNTLDDEASLGNPLILDREIRVAIEHAIDRQKLIDVAMMGYGDIGSTLIPAVYEFYHLDLGDDLRAYNPERAMEILEAAGYMPGPDGIRISPDGKPLDFRLIAHADIIETQKAAALIKEMLEEVGIAINVSVLDEGLIYDHIYTPDFDMFLWGWPVEVDPSYMLSYMTTDQHYWWNDCYYSNPAYDALYLEQLVTLDRNERQQIVHEMQRIFYDDCPYIIYAVKDSLQAYRTDKFEGWVRSPRNGGVIFANGITTYEQLRPIGR